MAALATALVVGSFVWICSPPPAGSTAAKSDYLRVAPDFALQDSAGKEVHLSDYRGKVVVLNFWATWCGPCRIEVPWLNHLEMENANRRFAVLGISMDEQGWPVVKPFLAKLKVNYRVLIDNRQTSRLYGGVDVLPTTMLIDREGKIITIHAGIVNRKEFENTLEQLLRSDDGTAADGGVAGVPRRY
jgi:cytochrome c biogenesis protein CcmG/thiol:disulfide interchange protein DsbE